MSKNEFPCFKMQFLCMMFKDFVPLGTMVQTEAGQPGEAEDVLLRKTIHLLEF